ncbi:DeoR family transcriptional regulator [Aquamicrobium ahrensii]|uniref:DeoR/GlpR family transcriptional regulator of sugar metabolism n=1 Tax=Aquamicrobium ahrensii TaxID=469551 RepID=A0ABV2KQZ0_9HYPH
MPPTDNLTARQQWILRHIQDRGFATIEAMAEEIGVSAQTVRRELIALERQNYLIRFHGGAGLRRDLFRIGYAQKLSTGLEGKQRIEVVPVSETGA